LYWLQRQLNHSPVVKELVKGLDFPSRGWSFKKTATRMCVCMHVHIDPARASESMFDFLQLRRSGD
jgi:hypothetical protein